jgi:hypothetical protein
MQTVKPQMIRFTAILAFLAFLIGCAGSPTVADPSAEPAPGPDRSALDRSPLRFYDLDPVQPQPRPDTLESGLAVIYHHHYFARSLDPLTGGFVQDKPGTFGKPVLSLNHQFGRNEVFDSGTNRGVGVRIQGLLKFPRAGEYTFHAVSNDGLRVYIDNTRIIDDPSQHSDRFAVPAVVTIDQPGWYSFRLEYFQRKGTAALQLFWRAPNAADFEPVPPEAFGHRAEDKKDLPLE